MTNEDVDINGERRRIAIITGANGVLGVSIAQRLLEGVGPVAALEGVVGQEHERIRIILACRSRQKAEGAVASLRKWFPERSLLLDVEDLDLCSMRNVEDFCRRMVKQGRIIDWLIFNAGVAEVVALNWFIVFEQLIKDAMMLFTVPRYLIERVGSKTADDLGLVFQANVFGHYYILKRLSSLLTSESKVLWSASLETAMPHIYDPDDPTGIRTNHSYASSKRFIELLHCYIATHQHVPMYFLTHPGITDSGVVSPYDFPVREIIQELKRLSFYTARYIGSPWHSISGRNGALSMVYCALKGTKEDEMIKWGSGSDRWGRERLIGTTLTGEAELWDKESKAVFDIVESLYKEWAFKLGVTGDNNGEGKSTA